MIAAPCDRGRGDITEQGKSRDMMTGRHGICRGMEAQKIKGDNKTWEPDQLVHAVRPGTGGIKEAGWNGNFDWETGILGDVLPKKEKIRM